MRDMVAQCESNMSELQQLQVRSPVSQFPQVSAQRPPAELHLSRSGPGELMPACRATLWLLDWTSRTTLLASFLSL